MFPITLLIECCCLIFSCIYLRKPQVGYWRYFIGFMGLICLLEGSAWVLVVFFYQNNHWIYNLELPLEVCFTMWIFNEFFNSFITSKPWYIAGLVVFSISYFVEIVLHGFMTYAHWTGTLMSLLFVVICGLYFYMLLQSKDYINLARNPPFWAVAGMFMFYFGSTITNLFFDELIEIYVKQGIQLRYFIFTGLNAILYSCWSYAFLCRYRQTISS